MKLFLTSQASQVLKTIIPLLSKPPSTSTVAFVPTASDPYEARPWLEEDRKGLTDHGFKLMDVDIKNISSDDLRSRLEAADVLFVAGGNVFYLMQHVRSSGFDIIATELLNKGIPYIGSSAGSVITAPDIKPFELFDDPSKAALTHTKGMNLVPFSVVPHYGKEKYKPYHEKLKTKYGNKHDLRFISNDQFIYVDNSVTSSVQTLS